MQCPKCGFDQAAGRAECIRCGVIFAKWRRERGKPVPLPILIEEEPEPWAQDGSVGRKERIILGSGLLAAILIYVVPFTRTVFSVVGVLLHELGHTAASWLLGHPAIPAFDFVYGGGWTHSMPFQPLLALAILAGMAALGWLYRNNRRTQILLAALALLYLFIVISGWRRELVFTLAGHGGELILAAIFFYQALSGVGWRSPDLERPLGAFVAFFVQLHFMHFAWRLISDTEFVEWYLAGKGGALNDLELVALDLHIKLGIRLGLSGVAAVFLAFSFLPFLFAFLLYRKRSACHQVALKFLSLNG